MLKNKYSLLFKTGDAEFELLKIYGLTIKTYFQLLNLQGDGNQNMRRKE